MTTGGWKPLFNAKLIAFELFYSYLFKLLYTIKGGVSKSALNPSGITWPSKFGKSPYIWL